MGLPLRAGGMVLCLRSNSTNHAQDQDSRQKHGACRQRFLHSPAAPGVYLGRLFQAYLVAPLLRDLPRTLRRPLA